MEIRVGDIVLHKLSQLYFICENRKHEKWMNMNPYYVQVKDVILSSTYFKKLL